MKKKIGIFYGPTGGKTEGVAQKLQAAFGRDKADLIAIKGCKANDLNKYDNIIFGCSTLGKETWNAKRPNDDWDLFRPEIEKINYQGKTIALFGLGDSVKYAANFVNSMGVLANIMLSNGAKIIGKVSTSGYNFTHSDAVIDSEFIGLPIDEDFEAELTDQRIGEWVKTLLQDFN